MTTPEEDKKHFRIGCATLMVVFIGFMFWAFSGNDTSKEPSKLDAYVISQQFVQQKLKAPSSAKFPAYKKDMVITNNNERFKVESYVESKNSFGSTIRNKYICIVTYLDNGQWKLNTLELLD